MLGTQLLFQHLQGVYKYFGKISHVATFVFLIFSNTCNYSCSTGIIAFWIKLLLKNNSNKLFFDIPEFLDIGHWTLISGLWTLDSRLWILDTGLCMLDAAHWTLGPGHWALLVTVSKQNQTPVSESVCLNHWKFFGWKSVRTSWSQVFCREYRF